MTSERRLDVRARNLVFGIQDAAVTTIGILAGVSAVELPRIYIARVVGISVVVSAVSMGIGSYQSERTAQNFEEQPNRREMFFGALIMSAAYFCTGLFLMAPIFLVRRTAIMLLATVALALILSFMGSWYTATEAGVDPSANALEAVLLSSLALAAGFVSGRILRHEEQVGESKVHPKK